MFTTPPPTKRAIKSDTLILNTSKKFGRANGIRTHTEWILSPLPLPIGILPHMEGDTGLEPAPSAWKAEMLATNTNPPYKRAFLYLCHAPVT